MLTRQLSTHIVNLLSPGKLPTGKVTFGSVGGGSINKTYKVTIQDTLYLCKINSASKFPQLFEKECNGLNLIGNRGGIQVPKIFHCFQFEDYQVLILGWIEEGQKDEQFWVRFGEQMAALHSNSNEYFGLNESNYMGSLLQLNKPSVDWAIFFNESRLQPMVARCYNIGALSAKHLKQFERIFLELPEIFGDRQKPVLVHGDLWSGNFLCNKAGDPVLIDPAVSYAHPSVDLGMSTLFGGFNSKFYEAYHYCHPFPSNFKEQWEVCNLYPLLVHLFLFGNSYLSQILETLHKY
jgi:fructosamine-3-kinase